MKKKVYYACLIGLLVIAIIFNNIKLHHKDITMMYIHLAEQCTKWKLYDLSNFYYTFAQNTNSRTIWLDYNIAKNIISKHWGKPVTAYKKQELEKAIKHLDIEIQKYPNNADINAEYAYAYEEMQDYDKAIEYYEKCIKKVPKWEYGLFHLAKLYSQAKRDYAKGLEYIDRALEVETSNNNERYFAKAWILSALEKYDEAIVYYNNYLEKNPNSVAALVNISGCEIEVKDYENAEKHVLQGLKLNPHSSYLIKNKIKILKGQHKFEEARKMALELSKYKPNGYFSYWQLAEINRYEGNINEAEKYYQMAKDNAQEYYDKYCEKSYDSYDIDGNCSNRYDFLQDFEKEKAKKLSF